MQMRNQPTARGWKCVDNECATLVCCLLTVEVEIQINATHSIKMANEVKTIVNAFLEGNTSPALCLIPQK